MRYSVMAAVCLMTACGGSSDCKFSAWKSGTFTEHFEKDGGNCGAIPDFNVFFDAGQQSVPAGCVINHQTSSETACTGDIDITCDDAPDDMRLHQVAHLDYDSDGNSASGTDTINATRLSDGSGLCASTYRITFTRQ